MKYHVEFDIDLKRNTSKGRYIVFEGIDGSGKTTQVEKITEYLRQQGEDIVKTREPRKDQGVIGELIQKILQGKTKIPPVAFQYLFSAEREIHHEELIRPSLAAGKSVLSDRCFWSVVPYGITDLDHHLDENTAEYMLVAQSILSMYHQFIVPDITFYLDVPLEVAWKRLGRAEGKREIYEDKRTLERTIKGYNWLLQKFPKEFIVIDATKSVEEVTAEIIKKL
ncbi:MAG: dTMP kinase [Patescibacteria group bacterium]